MSLTQVKIPKSLEQWIKFPAIKLLPVACQEISIALAQLRLRKAIEKGLDQRPFSIALAIGDVVKRRKVVGSWLHGPHLSVAHPVFGEGAGEKADEVPREDQHELCFHVSDGGSGLGMADAIEIVEVAVAAHREASGVNRRLVDRVVTPGE